MRKLILWPILAVMTMGVIGCGSPPPPPASCILGITVEGNGTVTPGSGNQYAKGTTVDLTETPGAGSIFAGWGGQCKILPGRRPA